MILPLGNSELLCSQSGVPEAVRREKGPGTYWGHAEFKEFTKGQNDTHTQSLADERRLTLNSTRKLPGNPQSLGWTGKETPSNFPASAMRPEAASSISQKLHLPKEGFPENPSRAGGLLTSPCPRDVAGPWQDSLPAQQLPPFCPAQTHKLLILDSGRWPSVQSEPGEPIGHPSPSSSSSSLK